MNNKYLFWGSIFAGVAVFLAVISYYFVFLQNEKISRGHYTFEQTRENVQKLQRIEITTPDYGSINIYRDGDVWRFKEAENYFINTDMLASFYNMINNSIVMVVQDDSDELYKKSGLPKSDGQAPLEVRTFNAKGKVLDEFQIGNTTSNGEYRFAKKPNSPFIYSISEVKNFSGKPLSWVPFPLLMVDNLYVSAIVLDGKYIDREFLDELLPHSSLVQDVMNIFSYVLYDGIILKKDFFEENPKAVPHIIKIETVIGLVYVLNIYNEDDNYFIGVDLTTTKIADAKIKAFIEENKKYFENWLFMMDGEQGKSLYDIRLR